MPKKKDEQKKKLVVVEEVVENEPVKSETEEEIATNEENNEKGKDLKEELHEEKEEKHEEEKKEENEKKEEVDDDQPTPQNYLWIIIPTALLVGALVGGLITYFSGISNLDTNETPLATPTIEASPVPSASPVADKNAIQREDLKIQVLNGSGTAGAAGKAKAALEALGYKNVEVGNASSSNFETTEISIKETKKTFLETLKTDLSKSYELNETVKTLSASSKYDIVITLGKK